LGQKGRLNCYKTPKRAKIEEPPMGRHVRKITRQDVNPALQLGAALCRRSAPWASISSSASTTAGCTLSPRARASGAGEVRARRALVMDVNNIRYLTSTKIGEWERDKICRWALLRCSADPILWDFGSAAVHHKLYAPWLKPENCKAGLLGLRGTVSPSFGLMAKHAGEIASIIREAGVIDLPVGIDIIEPPMMFELQKAGLKIEDGQQVMLEAREIKSADEIALLNRAAAMVDGAYHLVHEELKPGVRENDIVAMVNEFSIARLRRRRGDQRHLGRALQSAPAQLSPTACCAGRPGVLRHPAIVHGLSHLLLPTFNVGRATPVQHDAYKKAREWLDNAIALIKPGVSTDKVASVWPKAPSSAFPTNFPRSACSSAMASAAPFMSGRSSRAWCRSSIRPRSRKGMVFALETYCPAKDGYSAARIEEEVVVTDKGCRVITLFPAEELPIANRY
jgi:Xaa-Pro dipeptidase